MRNVVFLALILAGCSGGKAPVADELGADLKADSFSSRSKYLGTFSFGQKIPLVQYTKKPRYRMIGLTSPNGLVADIWVRSTNGDPVVWLLDYQKNVIASNDDADDTTTDAHLALTLPASNGYYYLVVRDYSLANATFQVMTSTSYDPSTGGTAEQAYDLAAPHLEDYKYDPIELPKDAYDQYQAYAKKFAGSQPGAYRIDGTVVGTLYVVSDAVEELYWVDLYDSTGKKLAHGYSGDGGPDVGWAPSPYDPSTM